MDDRKKAVIAFICAVAGLLAAYLSPWFVLSLILGITGILFSRKLVKSCENASDRGMATAGFMGSLFSACIGAGSVLGFLISLS